MRAYPRAAGDPSGPFDTRRTALLRVRREGKLDGNLNTICDRTSTIPAAAHLRHLHPECPGSKPGCIEETALYEPAFASLKIVPLSASLRRYSDGRQRSP
jgi:hypothetical protein